MILPTKGIAPTQALVSVGGAILARLTEPKTVSRLWDEIRMVNAQTLELTFDWFVLALDFLFIVGAINHDRGRILKVSPATDEVQP